MISSNRSGVWINEDGVVGTPDPSNLYRYVGNNPTNATDPTGLQRQDLVPLARLPLHQWDWPGVSTDDARFTAAWHFSDDEMLYLRRGCVGLCAIRTGSYRQR